ncbi:hypothetical protein [Nocardia wallacei]|uniref:hypothetical protein n=1 Tax=Nocardia wallacei TaxID=480035 RepID=UPI00245423CB|nr:hypothetical protein [Nocardia wallacei]
MRSLRVAAVAAALAVAGCAADGGQSSAPQSGGATAAHVRDCTSRPHTEPAEIIVTCADGNLAVTDIRWESWTSGSAHGAGIQRLGACDPNCASGQQQSTPVAVRLSAPEAGVFTRLETVAGDGGSQVYPLPR